MMVLTLDEFPLQYITNNNIILCTSMLTYKLDHMIETDL